MDWKSLFPAAILRRGQEYQKRKTVKDLKRQDNLYMARVLGSEIYSVRIIKDGEKPPIMSCTCPYAENGARCKHMAAVLYEMEKQDAGVQMTLPPAKSERIHPFTGSEDYRYFDMAYMTRNMRIYKSDWERAEKLAKSGQVYLDAIDFGYENRIGNAEQIGLAYGIEAESGEEIRAAFRREGFDDIECFVPFCETAHRPKKNRSELCVHELALLYHINEYLKENDVGDATDYLAEQMLWHFRVKNAVEMRSEENEILRDVTLEPRLTQTRDGWELAFRVGIQKKLIAKDLPLLIEAASAKARAKIGSSMEIDFASHTFDEISRPYFELLRNSIRNEIEKGRQAQNFFRSYNTYIEPIKDSLSLYGERWDTFFDAAKDTTVEYQNKNNWHRETVKGQLTFSEKPVPISLTITKDEDNRGMFHGIMVEGELPTLLYGRDYAYYLQNGMFCRIPKEQENALSPLFEQSQDGKVQFFIGRYHLSEFYYRVLPELSEYVTIDESERDDIRSYLPPEVAFLFRLDAENDRLTCHAFATYGEECYSLMDLIEKSAKYERFRDTAMETLVLRTVQSYFPEADIEEDAFYSERDSDGMYRILDSGVSELLGFGEVQSTDAFRRIRVRKMLKITVGVSVESGIMDLDIHSDDVTNEELLEILSAYRKKKKYYRLKNGDFLKLSDDEFLQLDAMMAQMHILPKEFVAGKMHLPLYRAFYIDKMLEEATGLNGRRSLPFKELVKSSKTVSDADFDLPSDLRDVMRKYQIYGYRWMRMLSAYGFGGILADDMGLGKTVQVLSVLLAEKMEGNNGTSIVVCPASLVYNWLEECHKFTPSLSAAAITGTVKERATLIAKYGDYDLIITSYDLLKRDIVEYEGQKFRYAVIDEAQYIKNHTTAAAKSVKLLDASVRMALTGTPIENRLSELWSIFDFLMPGFLFGYEQFRDEYEKPIVKNKDADTVSELRRMVSPFILRRLKKDVLTDLPDKLEEVRYARMEDKQQHLYDGQIVRMKELVSSMSEEDWKKNRIQVLAELTRTRQICCDPALYVDPWDGGSAKREACMQMIESAMEGEHKMLIFSQFTSMLELLEDDLKAAKIAYFKLTGATPKEERISMAKKFNQDDTPVFLISLRAGGTGLNLTGADVVIHYDPWWNVAVQNQATDRAHRIGQEKIVSVYKLIVKDTIEEKIVKLQETKQDLADEILSGELGSLSKLTKDELMKLL